MNAAATSPSSPHLVRELARVALDVGAGQERLIGLAAYSKTQEGVGTCFENIPSGGGTMDDQCSSQDPPEKAPLPHNGPGGRRLAVLIDGDNAQPDSIPDVMAEVDRYGTATVRRIYADWSSPNTRPWIPVMTKYCIQPVQQFRAIKGKNASDIALIIDAMDLLHGGIALDGFCLVSSDSDFSRLASRLREDGHLVLGFGRQQTPLAFRASCNKFIYTGGPAAGEATPEAAECAATQYEAPEDLIRTLDQALLDGPPDAEGWVSLGDVGTNMLRLDSTFTPKQYGHSTLGKLFTSLGSLYDTKSTGSVMWVRVTCART
eukprot:jgi/Tetstr1/436395/TSEL_025227.t2